MTIKKTGIAASAVLALSAVFSTAAMAKPVDLSACTKDGQTATLSVDVEGTVYDPRVDSAVGTPLEKLVRDAWTKTAHDLTVQELVSQKGEEEFAKNLSEELKDKLPSNDATLAVLGGDITPGCGKAVPIGPYPAPNQNP